MRARLLLNKSCNVLYVTRVQILSKKNTLETLYSFRNLSLYSCVRLYIEFVCLGFQRATSLCRRSGNRARGDGRANVDVQVSRMQPRRVDYAPR